MPRDKDVMAPRKCAMCGAQHQDAGSALVHKLVAHGPLAGPSGKDRKRKRVRALGRRTADLSALPEFGNRLERAGFGEVEAHIVIRLLAEELCKAGLA